MPPLLHPGACRHSRFHRAASDPARQSLQPPVRDGPYDPDCGVSISRPIQTILALTISGILLPWSEIGCQSLGPAGPGSLAISSPLRVRLTYLTRRPAFSATTQHDDAAGVRRISRFKSINTR